MTTNLDGILNRMREVLRKIAEGRSTIDTGALELGAILAKRPEDVTAKDVYQALEGENGYAEVKGDLSKAMRVASTFVYGLGKSEADCANILPRPKAWRRLYDAYTELVKPGKMSAQEAWDAVAQGWQHSRYGSAPTPSGKRHLVVSAETGEAFDAHANGADADTVVRQLLGETHVSQAIAEAVDEFLGAGGTEAALITRIRAATAKLKAAA